MIEPTRQTKKHVGTPVGFDGKLGPGAHNALVGGFKILSADGPVLCPYTKVVPNLVVSPFNPVAPLHKSLHPVDLRFVEPADTGVGHNRGIIGFIRLVVVEFWKGRADGKTRGIDNLILPDPVDDVFMGIFYTVVKLVVVQGEGSFVHYIYD